MQYLQFAVLNRVCTAAVLRAAVRCRHDPANAVRTGNSLNSHDAGDFGTTATDCTGTTAGSRKLDGAMANNPVALVIRKSRSSLRFAVLAISSDPDGRSTKHQPTIWKICSRPDGRNRMGPADFIPIVRGS